MFLVSIFLIFKKKLVSFLKKIEIKNFIFFVSKIRKEFYKIFLITLFLQFYNIFVSNYNFFLFTLLIFLKFL